MSTITRETRETRVRLGVRSGGETEIDTSDRFLDHMLETLARYAGLGLEVDAEGDLRHHLVEDVAITLGLALRGEVPESCRRYGQATVPMDDALVHAALDAGGRFYYEGPLPSDLYDHFLRSFAENAGLTLHVRVLRGRDEHHVVEAAVKAVGLALREALAVPGAGAGDDAGGEDGGGSGVDGGGAGAGVFSTKGAVRIEREDD